MSKIFGLHLAGFVDVTEFQIMGAGVLGHPGDHGPDIAHAVLGLGPLVVAVKALALGPKIHEEDGGLDLVVVLPGDDGLLGGVHAADVGAVFPAAGGVPGAHALDPGHFPGRGAVAGAPDMPVIRPGGGEDALELEAKSPHWGSGRNRIRASARRRRAGSPGPGSWPPRPG